MVPMTVDGPGFQWEPGSRSLFARREKKRRQAADLERAKFIAATWADACEGAGLVQAGHSAASMPVFTTPLVTHVQLGAPTSLTVRLRSGMIAADVQNQSTRLAECLGVKRISVELIRRGLIRVVLDPPDPLSGSVPRPTRLATAHNPVLFGQLGSGVDLRRSLVESTHIVVQGTTGSGKSVFCYNVLSQVAGVSDIQVVGSDPSGLLLQPFADTSGWFALGTKSIEMHAVVLERLAAEMDDRLSNLPAGQDKVQIDSETPLILGVLEEYPGLVREAARYDDRLQSKDKGRKLLPRIQAAYGRLLSEGRKAGIRLLIICQRADADILGGYERGQARVRFSFCVDTPDALKMLHPASSAELIEDHMVADAGISLVTAPGIKLDRMKAPDDYPFADYCHHVAEALYSTGAAA